MSYGQIAVSLVIAVGSALLSAALAPHPKLNLQDLYITSSAYGDPIPIVYGTTRVATRLIWSDGVKHEVKTGKFGKGGKGQTGPVYTANLAFSICEGPIEAVLRMWANGSIIYDVTGLERDPNNNELVNNGAYPFVLYTGTETQEPDPTIVSYQDGTTGENSTPAYRGIAYIVFNAMNLTKWGNQVPNIHVEVVRSNYTPTLPVSALTNLTPDAFSADSSTHSIFFDWSQQLMFYVNSLGVRVYDLAADREHKQRLLADIGDFSPMSFIHGWGVVPNGDLFAVGVNAFGDGLIASIDPNSLLLKSISSAGIFHPLAGYGIPVPDGAGEVSSYAILVGIGGQVGVVRTDGTATGLTNISDTNFTVGQLPNVLLANVESTTTIAYVVPSKIQGTSFSIYVLTTGIYANTTVTGSAIGLLNDSSHGDVAGVIDLADLDLGDAIYDVTSIMDYVDQSILFSLRDTNTLGVTAFKWNPETGHIVWVKPGLSLAGNGSGTGGGFGNSTILNSRLGVWYGTYGVIIDTATGDTIYNSSETALGFQTPSPPGITSGGSVAWDGQSGSVILADHGGGFVHHFFRLFLGRGSSGGVTVGSIVGDVMGRCGLEDSDFDATALTDEVAGYVLGRRTDGKSTLEQLEELFFFDTVESDNILKFIPRGVDPAVTITQDDLGETVSSHGKKTGDDNYWKHTKAQELDLMSEVHVKYYDPARNYQSGDQYDRRNGHPIPTMSAKSIKTIEVPLVLNATVAQQLAQKILFTAWVERDSYQSSLGWKYLWLDPSDVVAVNLDNGAEYIARTTKITTGANMTLSTMFVAQDNDTYTSIATGYSGDNLLKPGTAYSLKFTNMVLLDLPLLRDTDDQGAAISVCYYGCGLYVPGSWPGAEIFRSSDSGVTFNDLGFSLTKVFWGSMLEALPPTSSPFIVDTSYTITVFPYRGSLDQTLSSITMPTLLAGGNAAVVGGEVIQFLTATLNADSSYTLGGILRGMRGTDSLCNFHTVGETFVLLDPAVLKGDFYPTSALGQVRKFKGVTLGSFIDNATTTGTALTCASLKPYPPVQFTRADAGSDVAVTWVRRTRLGGGLRDGTGTVPLHETSEAYEVYVLPSAYAPSTFDPDDTSTYIRKVTGLTTPAWTYTAAQMTADSFTRSTDTLHLVAYQLSGAIGRGFPGFDSLAP